MSSNRISKIPAAFNDIKLWPTVDETFQSGAVKKRYERIRDAIELYLSFNSMKVVCEKAGVKQRRFHKIIDNCLKRHPDGRIWGLRALIKNVRINCGERTASFVSSPDGRSGYWGMFKKFMAENDGVHKGMISALRQKGSRVANLSQAELRDIHGVFKALCKEHGITDEKYPLNTKEKGKRSLKEWINKSYIPQFAAEYIDNQYGRSAKRAWQYAGGDGLACRDTAPYSAWQMDEVTIDVESKFILPNPQGDWEDYDISRPLVIRVVDVATGAKLANRLVLAPQATAEDASIVLWDAVAGSPEIKPVIVDLVSNDTGGYPANVIPELRFAVPTFVYLDNALAHLADHVQHLISSTWGGVVRLGNPMSPRERPEIEADFSAQAKKLMRKMPGATGGHPQDSLRKIANVELEDRIDTDALEQVIDTYCRNANGLPHTRSGNIPPLVRLRRQLDAGALTPVYLGTTKRKPNYFCKPQRVVVHMDTKSGRRPYINYLYRRYSSVHLQSQISLKGQVMWARPDFRNLQSLLLFYDSGVEFGEVSCMGPWGTFPHDVRIRKLFGRLKTAGSLGEHAEDTPLEALFEYLRSRAAKDRVCAQQLSYVMSYLLRHTEQLFCSMTSKVTDWLHTISAAEKLKVIRIDSDQVAKLLMEKDALATITNDSTSIDSTAPIWDGDHSTTGIRRNRKLPKSVRISP